MAQQATTTDPAEAIAAAIGRLGQATPAEIATNAGVAYSTTTRKLRDLAAAGRTEKLTTEDNRTLWRLAVPAEPGAEGADTSDADPSDAELVPAVPDQPDTDDVAGDNLGADGVGGAAEAGAGGQLPETGTDDEPTADATTATLAPAGAEPAESAGPNDAVEAVATGEVNVSNPASGSDEDGGDEASTAPTDPAAGQIGDQRAESSRPTRTRRAGGSLRGAILDILEAHPGQQYKIGEVCKLIDAANAGTDAAKASPGAVANWMYKLVAARLVNQTVDKPATFQLAATGD